MVEFLQIALIALVAVLLVLACIQNRNAGLGSAFGNNIGFYVTRRGIERSVFLGTFFVVFLICAISFSLVFIFN
jgi:preprotein translocase subunit SecG